MLLHLPSQLPKKIGWMRNMYPGHHLLFLMVIGYSEKVMTIGFMGGIPVKYPLAYDILIKYFNEVFPKENRHENL